MIEARALFDGPEHPVHVRVAGDDQRIYFDLADNDWGVVEITAHGWRIVTDTTVRFRRPKGMMALSMPERGGSIDELNEFLNIDPGSDGFVLLCMWMVAALRPIGPFPVLCLGGSHGAGKSYACRIIRSLIDPNESSLRAPPRGPHDLAISANNSLVYGLDNISEIRPWLSDCLSRLATGSGFSTRELYSDNEETLFSASRPVLLNGIGEVIVAPDLLDRTLRIDLDEIPKARRRTEKELMAAFQVAVPRIVGALLDGVVMGMRNIASTTLLELPRMADFACWSCACEPAMPWEPGTFIKAHGGSQRDADLVAIEANPVGTAIADLMSEQPGWAGTASELLDDLRRRDNQDLERPPRKPWPLDATRPREPRDPPPARDPDQRRSLERESLSGWPARHGPGALEQRIGVCDEHRRRHRGVHVQRQGVLRRYLRAIARPLE